MRFSIVPLLLLVLPVMEIAVFIFVGQHIGVLATITLIILTAMAGSVLLRVQGFSAVRRVLAELEVGQKPGRALVDAFMIFVAGVLLIVPGFLTDVLGIALFIPLVRHRLWQIIRKRLKSRFHYSGFRMGSDGRQRPTDDNVFDLEAHEFRGPPGSPDTARPQVGKDKE